MESSASPFACNLEQFKQTVAQFCKHAADPNVGMPALEQAHKLVGLRYLNMQIGDVTDSLIASSYMNYANRCMINRQIEATAPGLQ